MKGNVGEDGIAPISNASLAQRKAATLIERETGFTITNAEISIDADGNISSMKIEAKSPHRWVVAIADELGRGTLESFVPGGRYRPNVRTMDGIPPGWEFSGRTRFDGARHTAKAFAHYLADNGTGVSGRLGARKSVAALMRSFEP